MEEVTDVNIPVHGVIEAILFMYVHQNKEIPSIIYIPGHNPEHDYQITVNGKIYLVKMFVHIRSREGLVRSVNQTTGYEISVLPDNNGPDKDDGGDDDSNNAPTMPATSITTTPISTKRVRN